MKINFIENNKCDFCDSSNCIPVCTKSMNRFVKCSTCGVIYMNPRPTDEFLKERAEQMAVMFHSDKNKIEWKYSSYMEKNIYNPILNKIKPYKKNNKILEIGCSSGSFLNAASKHDWDVFGVEVAGKSAEIAQEKGFNIFVGDVLDAKFDSEYFDAVVMYQTFEHLSYPRATLQEVYRILRKGGMLNISVPNLNSLTHAILGKKGYSFYNSGHMYLFTPNLLRHFIEQMNFNVIDQFTIDINPWFIMNILINGDTTFEEKGDFSGDIETNKKVSLDKNKLKKNKIYHFGRLIINIFLRFFNIGDNLIIYAVKKN